MFELWEGAPKAFMVVRTGDVSAAVSVVLETDVAQGTAAVGADFTIGLPAGVIDFAPGEFVRRVPVTAPRDSLMEGIEHARLILRSPTGAVLGRQSHLRLLVRDNRDLSQRRDFVTGSGDRHRVGEMIGVPPVRVVPEGESVTFQVSSFPLGEGGSVDVGAVGGTATPGVDFTDPSMRLAIPPSASSVDLTLSTVEDSVHEGVEVVELLLSNPLPTGAVRNLLALALIEDDEPGQAGLLQLRPLTGTDSRVDVGEGQGSLTLRVLRTGGRAVSPRWTS